MEAGVGLRLPYPIEHFMDLLDRYKSGCEFDRDLFSMIKICALYSSQGSHSGQLDFCKLTGRWSTMG